MKRVNKAKVKTLIDVVKEHEVAYSSVPIPTWNQVHFYNNAFWELIQVIQEDLGENYENNSD